MCAFCELYWKGEKKSTRQKVQRRPTLVVDSAGGDHKYACHRQTCLLNFMTCMLGIPLQTNKWTVRGYGGLGAWAKIQQSLAVRLLDNWHTPWLVQVAAKAWLSGGSTALCRSRAKLLVDLARGQLAWGCLRCVSQSAPARRGWSFHCCPIEYALAEDA